MELYLVKLNHPLRINNGTEKKKDYTPLYGFYFQHQWNIEKHIQMDVLNRYLGYVAAVHEWSNNSAAKFSVESADIWVNKKDKKKHSAISDEWSFMIGELCRRKLGVGGTLYVLDIDETSDIFLDEGFDGHFIMTESLMKTMVGLAEEQKKRWHTVCLFNRPLWLPKPQLWEEEGYCHIYGVITDDYDLSEELKTDLNYYLGYLALCEEYYLTGTTPSGYTTEDGVIWFKNGQPFNPKLKEMVEECKICQDKHNLKICTAKMRIPAYDLAGGVRNDLLIDQKLYEDLLSVVQNDRLDVWN